MAIYTADPEKYPVLFSGQKNKQSGVNRLHLSHSGRPSGYSAFIHLARELSALAC